MRHGIVTITFHLDMRTWMRRRWLARVREDKEAAWAIASAREGAELPPLFAFERCEEAALVRRATDTDPSFRDADRVDYPVASVPASRPWRTQSPGIAGCVVALVVSAGSFGGFIVRRPVDRTMPHEVRRLSHVVDVAASGGLCCAVRDDGSVYCWGELEDGLLSHIHPTLSDVPVAIPGLVDVTSLSLGFDRSCARRRDGTVRCWGSVRDHHALSRSPTTNGLSGVKQVVVPSVIGPGPYGLLQDGTVFAWEPADDASGTLPQPVDALRGSTQIALSSHRLFGLSRNGTLHYTLVGEPVWDLMVGEGGPGFEENWGVGEPRPTGVVEIAAYAGRVCDRRADGHAWCRDYFGHRAPDVLDLGVDVVGISVGQAQTCAVRRDGTAVCWRYREARVIPGLHDARLATRRARRGRLERVRGATGQKNLRRVPATIVL
jgi:hypothetical protein